MVQDTPPTQTVEELQRRLTEIEQAMQAQIAALREQTPPWKRSRP